MIPATLYEDLKSLLSLQLQQPVNNILLKPVGGGSINQTYQLTLPDKRLLFCKINNATLYPNLFLTEKNGLQLIGSQQIIKVPHIHVYAVTGNYQVLLMEWVESGTKNESFWQLFGQQLAALHQVQNSTYGLHQNNYMGSVPQDNTTDTNWSHFLMHRRLMPLVSKCVEQQLLTTSEANLFDKLYPKLPQVFEDNEKPSLLHGDLWSGNYMCNSNSQPLLIDPAVYYGHRSVDLGITTLFGGFHKSFYEAYHYHFPLPVNHKQQWEICNLYPLLIHVLLFGKSYVGSIRQTLLHFT